MNDVSDGPAHPPFPQRRLRVPDVGGESGTRVSGGIHCIRAVLSRSDEATILRSSMQILSVVGGAAGVTTWRWKVRPAMPRRPEPMAAMSGDLTFSSKQSPRPHFARTVLPQLPPKQNRSERVFSRHSRQHGYRWRNALGPSHALPAPLRNLQVAEPACSDPGGDRCFMIRNSI